MLNISVIVPVFNRENTIGACLASILRQDAGTYEVIVVDDGSTDATSSIIRSFKDPRITLIVNEVNKGLCYSRNKGISQARGEIIAFTDSDCIAELHWLQELVKPFDSDEHIMITGGRVLDGQAHTYWEKVNNGMDYIAPASGYVDRIIGCNMAIRQQFLKNNPFDGSLSSADEWDLCINCKAQKKKIFYTDKAKVTHHHRTSMKASLVQHFGFGYSNAKLMSKHRHFPFINYGSMVLLLIGSSLACGAWLHPIYYLSTLLSVIYACLIGYWNTRGGTRGWMDWIVTLPGYVMTFTGFCFGNLYFHLRRLEDKS